VARSRVESVATADCGLCGARCGHGRCVSATSAHCFRH